MTSKSKIKGNAYERELVKYFLENEIQARRTWGSCGKSAGLDHEVDLIIQEDKVAQVKIRAKLPQFVYSEAPKTDSLIKWLTNVDCCIFRGNNKPSLVVMTLDSYIKLLK